MDKTDRMILDLLRGDARISYQELGDKIGMSRVAAKKRVRKLEKNGIIRGYNTCIYREEEITMFIDILTYPDKYEDVPKYISTRTAYIRQIFRTTKENHIHMVAVSDSARNLACLIRMIQVIKDVYGGIRYENRTASDPERTGSDRCTFQRGSGGRNGNDI